MNNDVLRERVAALIHLQWRLYMGYHLNKFKKIDGRLSISEEYWTALRDQIGKTYQELSEPEKELDRIEADKVIALFEAEDILSSEAALASEYGPDWLKIIGIG